MSVGCARLGRATLGCRILSLSTPAYHIGNGRDYGSHALHDAPAITVAEPASSAALLDLDYNNLNLYTQTMPPSEKELRLTNRYFTHHPPSHLFTAAKFHQFPADSVIPEVTFLGRSNVGKSSLLNAIFNRHSTKAKLAYTSSRPGKTTTMNVFGIGQAGGSKGIGGGSSKVVKPGMSKDLLSRRHTDRQARKGERAVRNWMGRGGLVIVDCPGYGFNSRREWGDEVVKYLRDRKQLRRAFVLVDSQHGLKNGDREILSLLRQAAVPHQVILSKVDKIIYPHAEVPSDGKMSRGLLQLRSICEDIRSQAQPDQGRGPVALGDILCCSSAKAIKGKRLGIDGIRWAILQACGLSGVHENPSTRTDSASELDVLDI